MPLPLILGAAALAAAGFGAKKGYDGYQTKSQADEIIDNAKEAFEKAQNTHDERSKHCNEKLNELGTYKLNIGKNFNEFKEIADELIQKLNKHSGKEIKLSIPQHELDKIEKMSYSAVSILGSIVGGSAVGAVTAYAVYGGVLALGAASTGTAISSLSGVAAYNAAMAALGGGSLAAGGFGMAGGMAVLGATVAAPLVAIAGWAYNSHAEEALENARKIQRDTEKAIFKMELAVKQLGDLEYYVFKIKNSMDRIYNVFTRYFNDLKHISLLMNNPAVIENIEDEAIKTIENGYKVAEILVDIINTPLFKFKENDEGQTIYEDNVPQLETDENGLKIINIFGVDNAIEQSDRDMIHFYK